MAWLTAAMLGLSAAGTYMSVRGQLKAGQAEKDAGEAAKRAAEDQAQLAEFNAAIADLQAKDTEVRGEQEAQRFRVRTRQLIGEQRAGFAAGNVDVGYGSTVDVQADTAFIGELDALTVKTNAAREAWGYRIEATDLRKRAQIARKEGDAAVLTGIQRRNAMRWGAAGSAFNAGFSLLEAKYGWGNRGGK